VSVAALLATAAGVSAGAGLAELLAARRPRRRRPRGLVVRLVARLGAAVGVRASSGLAQRVAAAGVDRPVAEIVALQGGLAVLAALAVLPLATAAPGRLGLALALAAPAGGYLAPELALRRRARQRRKAIEAELPDVLDLLRVAIAAGLAPRRALTEVGRRHPGTLARELKRAAARATLGEPAEATLSRLEARCRATGVPAFVAALRRAERHGAPLAQALAAQATEARSRRAAHRSEQAAKASPKIQLVVALLLVPAVLLLVAAAIIPAVA
jgi:tight adherence protein C